MKYKEEKQTAQAARRTAKPEQGRQARSADLGIATKLRTPPTTSPDFIDLDYLEVICPETGEILQQGKLSQQAAVNEARNIRFKLQDASRDILYSFHGSDVPVNNKGYQVHHRTCTCTRFRVGSTAQIVKSETNNKAFFAGLMSCANSRTCPVCSAKISERKANEMRTAFNIARAENLNVSLLTFTAPHNAGDKLDDLKKGISSALEKFWRGSTAKRFKDKYGILGNIRSFEVRYGSNGWHPHFHIIIFSDRPLPLTDRDNNGNIKLQQSDEWNLLLSRWQSCCVRAGLSAPNKYGMDIQNGAFAGEYISKFGSDDEILQTKSGKNVTWDMADEMTKGNTKTGRKGSLSPWDLLAQSVDGETDDIKQNSKKLFLFYARAMQGVNLIRWSRGLRDYFDLGAQATDEEIIAQEEDKADLLCHIKPHEWEFIIKNKMRSMVLQLSETKPVFDDEGNQIDGGYVAIARLLYRGNEFQSFDDFFHEFKERNVLVDYDEVLTSEYETAPSKTGRDLSHSRVLCEHSEYLTKAYTHKLRPIFQAIADRDKKPVLDDYQLSEILFEYQKNRPSSRTGLAYKKNSTKKLTRTRI